MRILHVEDDDTFRKWVKQGLKESGFAVDGACNAKEAMQMASENLYDVILLDIGMPDLNGLWALRTLRQAGNTAAIFIISGNSEEQLKLDAFEGGADDYMVKPILVSDRV
jgi:DNA-binding response OmpR family regulator